MHILIRIFALPAAFLVLASPAPAQPVSPRVMDSLRSHFPGEASALATRLAGRPPEAARLLLGEAMEKFHQDHVQEIVAAPGATLIALERRHAAMLRSLAPRDMKLCATVGNLGFFSGDARSVAPPEGLDDYAVALIEAAAAGRGRPAPRPASKEDIEALLAEVDRRGPQVPVRRMLMDKAFRATVGDEKLCIGAALLHESAAALPPEQAAAASMLLIKALLVATLP